MKYEIIRDYISRGNARSGQALDEVRFIVSHDTGNPGSTAYANRNYFENVDPTASAHTFIDDNTILEIIPLDEKAWHVRYSVRADNNRYGADANDAAIGVELAWGGTIDFSAAYERYVWYHAYLIDRFALDPNTDIVAHSTLDPSRRTDPQNALNQYGVSWSDFIQDVTNAHRKYFNREAMPEPDVQGRSFDLPLESGSEWNLVEEVQQDLIQAGFPLPQYGADGIYGQETIKAVKRFQRRYGLRADGLVGQNTLAKLKEVRGSSTPINDFPLPDGIYRQGDRGEPVKQIQRALKAVGVNLEQIDGIYGPLTKGAVESFQSRYGDLVKDGIYGPNTKEFLEMELE